MKLRLIKYYVDMDGVLCKWDTKASLEDTYRKGYFLAREPDEKILNLVKDMRDEGKDVSILSCVYENGFCAEEKSQWLDNHGLKGIPRVFVPYGKNKEDFVNRDDFNVLLDDFTDNLFAWRSGGNLAFKYYNGINGTTGRWNGDSVNYRMSWPQIERAIVAIAEYAARAFS